MLIAPRRNIENISIKNINTVLKFYNVIAIFSPTKIFNNWYKNEIFLKLNMNLVYNNRIHEVNIFLATDAF